MSNQIASGIQKMDLNNRPRDSTMSTMSSQSSATSRSLPTSIASSNTTAATHDYNRLPPSQPEVPHLSPFPKLVNPPPNVPQTDDELETTLENARTAVLNSNDPEMQLSWAQDALAYCGTCADEAERVAATAAADTSARAPPRPATPRVEHQLRTDAVSIVSFLADQHHPKAEFLRGMWLEWGRHGQREDKKEAFRCYSRAADKGYARADYRIGMLYESYNDPVKALRHYHRGVEAGDAASCYRLGMMTLRGQHGQPQDFARGIELIRQSAEKADENAAQGAYVYGMLLARQLPQVDIPEGYLPLDDRKAKENIEKAAYMRFGKAQAKMGALYELGALGCTFSPALSIHYNALASKQGEADADMALSKWFLVGHEGLFPKNEALAYSYARRAAAAGLATAEFGLGYFHEIGMHVPIDLDKAREWYNKAAAHGNADARDRIAALDNKQVLSRQDHENVAVSRIKSQRGSMIAARPERFQQAGGSRLGAVNENGNTSPPPPRGSSITPYPPDNAPPPVGGLPPRAASAAPYPLESGPPAGVTSPYSSPRPNAGLSPGFHQQQAPYGSGAPLRPASAEPPRPGYASAPPPGGYSAGSSPMLQQGGPPGGGRPGYGGGNNLNRPLPPPGGQQGPGGGPGGGYDPRYGNRPGPGPGPGPGYGPGGRVVSGPAGYNNGGGGGYGGGGRGSNGGPLPPLPNQGGGFAGGRQDLGYSAPYEERRPQQYPNGGGGGAGPGRGSGGGGGGNYGPSSHSSQYSQGGSSRPPPGGGGSNGNRPGSSPRPGGGGSGGGVPPLPQKDSGGKPAAPPKTKPAAAAAPPKPTGPKTFDEMGVPQQKRDEDCVSFSRFSFCFLGLCAVLCCVELGARGIHADIWCAGDHVSGSFTKDCMAPLGLSLELKA